MSPDSPAGAGHPTRTQARHDHFGLWLFCIAAFGFGLRLALITWAERSLDCDESTVALMSLDIIERGARPMFFYGGAYNGGGALEAYLGSIAIAWGASPAIALKWIVALLWIPAAFFFIDVCKRSLPRAQTLVATLFLAIGTPFFLEWSIKARGGFAETLLFSAVLLWLANPRSALRSRIPLQCALFGLASGIGLWASEMILPMLPCAAIWLLANTPSAERRRAFALLLVFAFIGIVPLLAYNLGHEWDHLRQSTLAALLSTSSGAPLSPEALGFSLHFVLGQGAWLLAIGCLIGAARIAIRTSRLELGHVLLIHGVIYLFAFWISGLRFLDIPPTRVLYPLQLNIAVLLGWALVWKPGVRRWIAAASVALWLILVIAPTGAWMASGSPRDSGSWRASWCHVDGEALRSALLERKIDQVYTNYWAATPIQLSSRIAGRDNAEAAQLLISTRVSRNPAGGQRVGFLLYENSPVLAEVEEALHRAGIPAERANLDGMVLLSGLDQQALSRVQSLPSDLSQDAWPARDALPDGFN